MVRVDSIEWVIKLFLTFPYLHSCVDEAVVENGAAMDVDEPVEEAPRPKKKKRTGKHAHI
jgi:hypothetical protein